MHIARFALVCLALVSLHCSPGESPTATQAVSDKPVKPAKSVSAPRTPLPPEVASSQAVVPPPEKISTEILNALQRSPIVDARVISRRSMSLKVFFAGGGKAVFKPVRKDNVTALDEVAFYRLAQLLQIEGVPVSTVRQVSMESIGNMLQKKAPLDAVAFAQAARASKAGVVTGSMIQWFEDLEPSPFEEAAGDALLQSLLSGEQPSHPLAAAAANMVVLDFAGGNWDRFSGGNLFSTNSGKTLALIDNNNSFYSWNERQGERMDALLQKLRWIPASTKARLAALSTTTIENAMAIDDSTRGLLSSERVALLLARRDSILRRLESVDVGLAAESSTGK